MSLLNDALKEAEQRQQKPAPSPYTGQGRAAPSRNHGRRRVFSGIALTVALGIVGYAGWQFTAGPEIPAAGTARQASLASPRPVDKVAEADMPAQAGVVTEVAQATDQPEVDEAAPVTDGGADAEPATLAVAEPEPPAETLPSAGSTPAPGPAGPAEPRNLASQVPVASPGPDPRSGSTPDGEASGPAAATIEASGPDEPVSREAAGSPSAQPEATASVKQTRQTPGQRDLATSQDIRELMADGDLLAAEQKLAGLADVQDAPRSRYAFARGVLARGDVERSLAWVPAGLASRYPDLRLIRARALLAGGELGQAVSTLQASVPPVADHVEYRVTLATLLQQQGRSDRAASHWAALIAWDNGQAPWWVGLAIALEGRGDVPAARRAYQQAAALPGLAPSLADYVRQRLQTLGAG